MFGAGKMCKSWWFQHAKVEEIQNNDMDGNIDAADVGILSWMICHRWSTNHFRHDNESKKSSLRAHDMGSSTADHHEKSSRSVCQNCRPWDD
jgi:hypothetical protein